MLVKMVSIFVAFEKESIDIIWKFYFPNIHVYINLRMSMRIYLGILKFSKREGSKGK